MSWAAIGVSLAATALSVGMNYALAPDAPKGPDLNAASRAGTEAEAATLADRRALEAAAQQGGTASYQTAAHKEKVSRPFVFIEGDSSRRGGGQPSRWVPYVESEWAPGGKYFKEGQGPPDITMRKMRVMVPAQTKTADFTGYGEADVQGTIARQSAQNMLELQKKYGPQFIEEALREQELADPEGTAARRKVYDLIQEQANAHPDRPVADLLDKQVADQLAAGKGLDRVSDDVLRQAVGASLRARGETAGGEQYDQPLTTGFEGDARLSAAQQKALGWLTSGATPEDVQYRRDEQTLANEGAFVNGQTPESQFQNLSGAQNGPAPYYPGQPLSRPNPNAGAAMQGAEIQGRNIQMNAQANQVDPWMAGLSMLLRGAGAAGQGGWKPLATSV